MVAFSFLPQNFGRGRDLRMMVVLKNECTGWPQHRENREFGSYFFQTGKTQGILF